MNEMDLKKLILYEDEHIIVINKPSGLLSIEDGFQKGLPNIKDLLSKKYERIWSVHRLDKLTSGVMIFTKTPDSHRNLNISFSLRQIKKQYLAISHGSPLWKFKNILIDLIVNGDKDHRTIYCAEGGRKAETKIRVLDKNGNFSLLLAYPKTGYTHQIRAHLAMIGLPILGDQLYTRIYDHKNHQIFVDPDNHHLFLHAWKIIFKHPIFKSELQLVAPLPDYLNKKIKEFSFSLI